MDIHPSKGNVQLVFLMFNPIAFLIRASYCLIPRSVSPIKNALQNAKTGHPTGIGLCIRLLTGAPAVCCCYVIVAHAAPNHIAKLYSKHRQFMTYNEIARRALEQQGLEEWLGPQALEYERKLMEEYQRKKEDLPEVFAANPIKQRRKCS